MPDYSAHMHDSARRQVAAWLMLCCAMIFAMVVPNIIGVIILSPIIKTELNKYYKAINVKEEALEEGADDLNEML